MAADTGEIVDPHFHVWDLKQFQLPWLDRAGPLLKRDYSIADYREAVAGLGVKRSVYVEVSVTPEQREAEARFAAGLCGGRSGPAAAAVVGGTPGAEGFEGYVRKLAAENPAIHGVRTSLGRGERAAGKFVEDVMLLGKLGLSVDLLVDAGAMDAAADLAAAAPQTRFILDHCGNPSTNWFAPGTDAGPAERWRAGIKRLAKQPNVACKISGVAENGPPEGAVRERVAPAVKHCLDAFEAERVMFASNWPVCLKSVTIQRWVGMLREIVGDRGAAFEAKLFRDNATTWYRLG